MNWFIKKLHQLLPPARNPTTCRLAVEELEDRLVPSTVVAEFPGNGVWRYEDTSGWKQLTTAQASNISFNANGNVVGAFGVYG